MLRLDVFPRVIRQLLIMRRSVNTKATKTNIVNIFDRNAKRKQRNRACSARDAGDYDLLKDKASTALSHVHTITSELCI